MDYDLLMKFRKDFDLNVSGLNTCCEWIALPSMQMNVIKEALKILNRYNEDICNCETKSEFKEYIKLSFLREVHEDEILCRNRP